MHTHTLTNKRIMNFNLNFDDLRCYGHLNLLRDVCVFGGFGIKRLYTETV